MVSELKRGEVFKASSLFGREIRQYDVQTVNFRASKKFLSIAAIEPPKKMGFRLAPLTLTPLHTEIAPKGEEYW
jgi:hypothetical protein